MIIYCRSWTVVVQQKRYSGKGEHRNGQDPYYQIGRR
jgi:hypothetical protein